MDPKRNRNRMVRHSAIAMFDTDNIQDQVQVEVVVVVVDYAKTMMLSKNHDLGVQTMFLSKTMILLTISKIYGSFLLSKTMILLKSLNLRSWKISKLLLESPHAFGCHISTVWKPPHLLLVGGLEHDFYFSIIYGIIGLRKNQLVNQLRKKHFSQALQSEFSKEQELALVCGNQGQNQWVYQGHFFSFNTRIWAKWLKDVGPIIAKTICKLCRLCTRVET